MKWSTAEIKRILQNAVYVNENYRIVSKRQFKIAQRMLEIHTRATETSQVVSPLIELRKCAECNHYYMCGLNMKNGKCAPHQITTDELDVCVLKWLKNHGFEREVQNSKKLTRDITIRYVDWLHVDERGLFEIELI